MAGLDTYLQIDGIKGESVDDKHKDWIELLGFNHQMTQPTSQTKSSAGGAATGRTLHGDLVVHKFVDASSPKLYEAVSNGKAFKTMKIEVCRAGGSQLKYYEVKLEQVVVSNVTIDKPPVNGAANSASATDYVPTESVALNYGKIEWTYTQQKREDGSGGGNVTAKYDLTAGKA
jgi:type VI secretion system secreted protein Hcp